MYIKRFFYQLLADALIKKLANTYDTFKFQRIIKVAKEFDKWCINQNIYLK